MTGILQDQIAYYRARAGEYDEWFYRLGRYDRGPELNQLWFEEVARLYAAVRALAPVQETLELAAGTGIWTTELAAISQHVTALDASPEVLAINQRKIGDRPVTYEVVDLFAWQPQTQYDLVFMSFWLSHVPPERFAPFMDVVRRGVRPGGQVFMIDSLPEWTSTAKDHAAYQPDSIYHTRKLNDGQEYQIIKVFYDPDDLKNRLANQGLSAEVHTTGRCFWWAQARLR